MLLIGILGACGGSSDSVEGALAPAFSTQPADVTATEPAPATFTLAATGEPAPAIQWQLSTDGGTSWADVPGAIGQSHAIDPTGTALNGSRYRAVATNGLGSAVSEVVEHENERLLRQYLHNLAQSLGGEV